jgi:hypothetical protein
MTKYAHFTSQYIEQRDGATDLYTCILEVLGSNIGRTPATVTERYPVIFSVSPVKCRDSTSIGPRREDLPNLGPNIGYPDKFFVVLLTRCMITA